MWCCAEIRVLAIGSPNPTISGHPGVGLNSCGVVRREGQLQIVGNSRVQPLHGPPARHCTCASVPLGRVWGAGIARVSMLDSTRRDTLTQSRSAPKSGVRCWRVLLQSGKLGNEGSTTPTTTPNRANDATKSAGSKVQGKANISGLRVCPSISECTV